MGHRDEPSVSVMTCFSISAISYCAVLHRTAPGRSKVAASRSRTGKAAGRVGGMGGLSVNSKAADFSSGRLMEPSGGRDSLVPTQQVNGRT